MVEYKIVYTKDAQKDIQKLKGAHLDNRARALIEILKKKPLMTPPPCEKLLGNLSGAYSRRINIQHRLVYEVMEEEKIVKILSMCSHCGQIK